MRPLKNAPFAQSLRQTQILILEILNVFLWLKFSSSLTLNKIECFSKLSSSVNRVDAGIGLDQAGPSIPVFDRHLSLVKLLAAVDGLDQTAVALFEEPPP